MTDSPDSTVLAGLECAGDRGKETTPLEAVLALFDWPHDRLMSCLIRFSPLTVQNCEEAVKDALPALFQHLQQGRSRENLTGWLFQVVHNLGLKRLPASRRDSRNVVALTSAVEETIAGPGLNPKDTLAAAQR